MKRLIPVAAASLLVVAHICALATEPQHSAPTVPGVPLDLIPKVTPAPGETVEVDLLVGYTDTVRSFRGRRIDAFVRDLVAYTNAAFERSRIPVRLRLAGTALTSYRETGNPWADLAPLRDPGGAAADLHTRRDDLEADLIILLVHARPGRTCGSAYIIRPGQRGGDAWAFGTVAHQWAARNSVDRNWESCFTHEIGHLFGASHDPANASNPAAPDAHGYCRQSHPRFHTILVFNNTPGCPTPIGHFSNPHVTWRGHPTGTVETHNNARIMSAIASQLAGFRGERPPEVNRPLVSWHAVSPSRPGATGFVRIENLSDHAGTVDIRITDVQGATYPPVSVALEARAVASVRLTSIADDIGETDGAWILHSATTLDVRPLGAFAYGPDWLARTDVLLPAERDANEWVYRPLVFNPASNPTKRSVLRLINPFNHDAEVRISARDDAGHESAAPMVFTLPGGYVPKIITAAELEEHWGDGYRKWRPEIRSTGALRVMNLLVGSAGYIASLP